MMRSVYTLLKQLIILLLNLTKKCECGFNSNGQGYCPVPTAQNTTEWTKTVKLFGDNLQNKCHTMGRFDCSVDTSYTDLLKTQYKKTDAAHLYYNSVPCAQKVMSGSYIQYSIAFIMIALAFIF